MQENFLLLMDTKSLFYFKDDILGNIIEAFLNDTNSDLTSIELETFMTCKNKSTLSAKLIN